MSRLAAYAAVVIMATSPSVLSAQAHPVPLAEQSHPSSTNLRGVITDSLRLLVMEHSARIAFQGKTRRELEGPFWADYGRSVRLPKQWGDSDGWLVNYVGHPGHGAAAGFIWAHHDPDAPAEDSVFNKDYWQRRLRASAWSAAYSLQFELGPLSEASIGNVGRNPATTGWVDHVVTPLGGLAVMAAEDALDRYLIGKIESRLKNPIIRGLVRTSLNPARAMANVATGRAAWHRESRPLSGTR